MKLKEAIARIDKNKADFANVFLFALDANISACEFDNDKIEENQHRFKCVYIADWYCTDSIVGLSVYFLDDIAVAVGWKQGRKCSNDIKYISNEAAEKVHHFIHSLKMEPEVNEFEIINLNEEIGEHYHVNFGSELLPAAKEKLKYKDESVKFIKSYKDLLDWQYIDVELSDGSIKKVHLSDINIPYNID